MVITTLTRYADFRAQYDATGQIRQELDLIYDDKDTSLNTKAHQLFGLLYTNLTGETFDFEEGEVNLYSTQLDMAESEAYKMVGQLYSRAQKFGFNDFMDLMTLWI